MPNGLVVTLREQTQKVGPKKAYLALREAIKKNNRSFLSVIKEDFSLREMAQRFMGDNWQADLERFVGRRVGGPENAGLIDLREAQEVNTDASAFYAITGQLLIDTVREKYQLATKVGNEMFEVSPITNGNLQSQIEPWLGRVRHGPKIVNQGMEYPHTGFGPQYSTYPGPEKFGEICDVTFEMIFSDLTKQAVESAESVGEMTGMYEEYKKLSVAYGLVNNHSWNGTAYNTYLTSGAWINSLTSFSLTDFRNINTLNQLFVNMLDPVTGLPIQVVPKDIAVMPSMSMTAMRIFGATEVRVGDITTGAGVQVISANPIVGTTRILQSAHAMNLLVNGASIFDIAAGGFTAAVAATMILYGDFKKAFRWRQVYPVKVVQAPPLNPADFEQDIVMQVKASGYGVAVVKDPRFVARAYDSSAT